MSGNCTYPMPIFLRRSVLPTPSRRTSSGSVRAHAGTPDQLPPPKPRQTLALNSALGRESGHSKKSEAKHPRESATTSADCPRHRPRASHAEERKGKVITGLLDRFERPVVQGFTEGPRSRRHPIRVLRLRNPGIREATPSDQVLDESAYIRPGLRRTAHLNVIGRPPETSRQRWARTKSGARRSMLTV